MDKSKAMFVIIIVLLVIVLGATGAFAIIALNKLGELGQMQQGSASFTAEVGKLSPDQIKEVPIGDSFSTNLLDSPDGSTHAIKILLHMGLNMTDEKKLSEFESTLADKKGIVRDICLNVIRNTTYEDMKRSDGVEMLKEKILTKLQEEFYTNIIVGIYVADMAME